jgi:predicted nuclease of restriction endonuclease-like (RecB) superfamily
VGSAIIEHQSKEGWGAKIIDSLSNDLKKAFPEMKGFSIRNLKYMRQFASVYRNVSVVQEQLAQLSWYHNITIIQKVQNDDIRQWYVYKTMYSRDRGAVRK